MGTGKVSTNNADISTDNEGGEVRWLIYKSCKMLTLRILPFLSGVFNIKVRIRRRGTVTNALWMAGSIACGLCSRCLILCCLLLLLLRCAKLWPRVCFIRGHIHSGEEDAFKIRAYYHHHLGDSHGKIYLFRSVKRCLSKTTFQGFACLSILLAIINDWIQFFDRRDRGFILKALPLSS